MSASLKPYKKYQVEYGQAVASGWDESLKFVDWLCEKHAQMEFSSFWENEERNEFEIDKADAKKIIAANPEGDNEKTLKKILEDSDPDNEFIRMAIW